MREEGRIQMDNEGNNNVVMRSGRGGNGGEGNRVLGGETRRIRVIRSTRDDSVRRQNTLQPLPTASAKATSVHPPPPRTTFISCTGIDDHHNTSNGIIGARASGGSSGRGRPTEATVPGGGARRRVVQVVYYLSTQSGQLEHPHYMELDVSHLPPNQHLRLKDVVERLKVLRGIGMPSQYSWSCKRRYKNGYVWNDLTEDDIIYPTSPDAAAAVNEYVLKGCEILQHQQQMHTQHRTSSFHAQEGKLQQLVRVSDEKYITDAVIPAVGKQTISTSTNGTVPHNVSPSSYSMQNKSQMHLRNQQPYKFVSTIAAAQQPEQDQPDNDYHDDHNGDNFGIIALDDHDHNSSASFTCSSKSSHSSARCSKGVSTDDLDQLLFSHQPTEKATITNYPPRTTTNNIPNYNSSSNIRSRQIVVDEDGSSGRPHDQILTTTNGFTHSTRNSLLQLIACGSSSLVPAKNQLEQMTPTKTTTSIRNVSNVHKGGRAGGAVVSDNSSRPRLSMSARTGGGPVIQEEDEEVVMIKYMSENPRFGGLQSEEKEYFSGSMVLEARNEQNRLLRGDDNEPPATSVLKKSSSFKEERASSKTTGGIGKLAASAAEEDEEDEEFKATEKKAAGVKVKCIPRNVYNCYNSSTWTTSSSNPATTTSSKGRKSS